MIRERDHEVAELLFELEPAEQRHWEMFHGLATRESTAAGLGRRWRFWLELDRRLTGRAGREPTVHG